MTRRRTLASRIKALLSSVIRPGRRIADDDPEIARVVQRLMTHAGVNVTPDTALKTAVVWACVTYLARTVAQLPWRVMQETAGSEQRAPTHPVDWLLSRRPNPEMGAFAFRETMVGWAARWGNAVAEIIRDKRGVPIALWPIHPSRIEFVRDELGALKYRVSSSAQVKDLDPWDVFHVRGYGEGAIGLNVIAYAAESIGWAQATELFGASFFGNGVNPSGVVEVPGKLTPEGMNLLKEELHRLYAGPRNSSKALVVDNGIKFNKLSVEPESAQFIETRQHQVEEICRWFGVPPHKVMHLMRSTFSNIEHQSIEVVVDCIVPWCKRFEEEADYKLFGVLNRGAFFTKLDLKGLLRGDFKSRQEGLLVMRRAGIINGNEWRRLEEMNEIGEIGEKYIVEANMTTLERVGEQPAPPDPPEPATEAGEEDDDMVFDRRLVTIQRQLHQRVH